MNICKRVIGLEGDKVCTSGPLDLFKTHIYVSMANTSHYNMKIYTINLLRLPVTVFTNLLLAAIVLKINNAAK